MKSSANHNASALNRRQFLGDSARNAATAAAGVVGLSRSSVRAHSGSTPLRVGIIGVRNQGLALARAFDETAGCRVAAICDVDESVRRKAFRELKLDPSRVRAEEDARVLMEDPHLDALVIATPDHHHAWMAALAVHTGKHLYLEVPVTHTIEQADQLQSMIAAADVRVQIGLQHRSGTHYQSAIDYLHAGHLGDVRFSKAWACVKRQRLLPNTSKTRHVLSPTQQKLWLGPEEDCELAGPDWHHQWRCQWKFGSGELGSWGIPLLDLARWGLAKELPQRVTATGGTYHLQDGRETPDTMHVQFDYRDAAITWEHRQWTHRGLEGRPHGVAFYGQRGTLVLDRSGWKVYDSKDSTSQSASGSLEPHVRNFIEAIRRQVPLNAPYETGRISSQLCHLGNEAFRAGEPLMV